MTEESRDRRIGVYYHEGAQALAERVVGLEDECAKLRARSAELAALEAAGVDNWDGYSEAMASLEED